MWASEIVKDNYLNLVRRFCTEPQMFSTFKSNPLFRAVIGGHELEFCIKCYNDIEAVPEVFKNLSKFAYQDNIGFPQVSLVQHEGKKIDGNTLRYGQTVAKLHQTFGSLNGKTIFEWGSCYQGLAYCILKQWPEVMGYTPFDFPELLLLGGLYFRALDIGRCRTSTSPPYDLFLSELALTEQDDETLYSEYEKYGKNANGLFMRVNIVDETRRNNFLEYISNDFKIEVEEEHVARKPNLIVTGIK